VESAAIQLAIADLSAQDSRSVLALRDDRRFAEELGPVEDLDHEACDLCTADRERRFRPTVVGNDQFPSRSARIGEPVDYTLTVAAT